jgi:4-amino-4-deoxy-L-arabinose transferase-like glycosyltransferase
MSRLTRAQRVILLSLVAALLYLIGLGRPALWEPDEGRYAEIAREMMVTGDYVTPRDDWVRYFEKPPLVYWATAGAIRAFGPNEFAARLQAALASVAQVAIVVMLGEAMFDPATGMLAGLALMLSPLFFGFARFATPDPALAFAITAALAAFYSAMSAPLLERRALRNRMLLAAAMLALGTLAKGPVALVLGGAIAFTWLVVERRLRLALAIPWVECVLVYLAIVMPWFIMASRSNPGFLRFFAIHEHLQRYVESSEHAWGPWFFVPVTVAGTWPWIAFAAFGIRELRRPAVAAEVAHTRSALNFLLIWFALIFLFFSIPRSKLGSYILPGLPPLAILAGYGLARLGHISIERASTLLRALAIINGVLAATAVVTAVVIWRSISAAIALDASLGVLALMAGAIAAVLAARSRLLTGGAERAAAVGFVLAIGSGLAIGMALKAREDAAALFSYRALARSIAPFTEGGCVLASYRHFVQSMPFYLGVREKLVAYRGELAPFGDSPDARASFITDDAQLRDLWSSPTCVVLIANRGDLVRLHALLAPPPSVVGCEGKKFALINRTNVRPTAQFVDCAVDSMSTTVQH